MSQVLRGLGWGTILLSIASLDGFAVEPNRKSAGPHVTYQKRTQLDFEGMELEGRLKNPAEFYFKFRDSEQFGSLLKRRKNFHREMMRDSVLMK